MSTLKLNKIGEIKTEKERTDGKVQRQYYTCEFVDSANPFNMPRIRNFFQQHSADGKSTIWKGASPEMVKPFLGKLIPGVIVTRNVQAYPNTDKSIKTLCTKYTSVVLSHETVESVFKAAGHIIDDNTSESVEVTEKAGNIALKA